MISFRPIEKNTLLRSLSTLPVLLACALALSCARKSGAGPEPAGRAEAPAAVPARTADLPMPAASMKSIAPAESASRGAQFDSFVPSGAEAPRYPSDYLIGPLDPGSAEAAAAAAAFARGFAAAAAEGKPLVGFYLGQAPVEEAVSALPATRESEAADAARAIAALGGKAVFRVGSPASAGPESASFLVRFLSGTASVSGELLLGKDAEGSWGVLSFVLGPPDPRGNADGSPDSFDPLTYNRFL